VIITLTVSGSLTVPCTVTVAVATSPDTRLEIVQDPVRGFTLPFVMSTSTGIRSPARGTGVTEMSSAVSVPVFSTTIW
jgi:hypothetical protein